MDKVVLEHEVIIIGAGAAGLMTAITAASLGVPVLLLDGQDKIGAKILMSGGTRCNVTNTDISEKDYNSHQLMRVRNILRGFDSARAIRFFKDLGVELVLEPTGDTIENISRPDYSRAIENINGPNCRGNWGSNRGKYFPITHSGKTVLDALFNKCREQGIAIKTGHKVMAVDHKDGVFTVRGAGFSHQARAVVLTTGGLSYPSTGSDGTGYRIAQCFGHNVIKTTPALTPLTTDDADFRKLSGISLPVTLTLFARGKKQLSISGDFLFTHFGFSGPVVLDLSRHWLAAQEHQPQIFANFMPTENTVTLEALIQATISNQPKKLLKNFLSGLLPQRLTEVLLAKAGIDAGTLLNQVSKEARKKLISLSVHYPLVPAGVVGYSKAEVTAGGIDLCEVDPKTLESKYQPGLFFAGEILDVDGRIGGFNFQWAWASGYTVGTALAKQKGKS